MASTGVTKVVDGVGNMIKGIAMLTSQRVMVGVPADHAAREGGEEGTDINNAALAYIHDNGAPEANIPARPFMKPGIESAKDGIDSHLEKAGKAGLAGKPDVVDREFHITGLIAQAAIRAKINEGIPPPLAKSTLQARARRGRKGAQKELQRRADGEAPGVEYAKPLIDTGQLRNSINYVIRKA